MTAVNLVICIPAICKDSAEKSLLLQKMAGHSLIQRAIDKAGSLPTLGKLVLVATNTEEIALIASRNGVEQIWIEEPQSMIEAVEKRFGKVDAPTLLLWLSPFAPGIGGDTLLSACESLVTSGKAKLVPGRWEVLPEVKGTLLETIISRKSESQRVWVESSAFLINFFDPEAVGTSDLGIVDWTVGDDAFVISSRRDWWVCEKLLRRRRIVFRVIGNNEVGMGHIYRALSLASELTDHEVLFVCLDEDGVALRHLGGFDYWTKTFSKDKIISGIQELNPDLVVNDILDTSRAQVEEFQRRGIKVANFEDLGEGASVADLTINELYDSPKFDGKNVLWGQKYFFVRDEFIEAKVQIFSETVDRLLLTFGGTDQHNLSKKIYFAVRPICRTHGIKISIVTGPGYEGFSELSEIIDADPDTEITHATGVISQIMERTQLAITSNGRTIYELAHMNIPAVVISQHDRERTHAFAAEDNGMISVGLYEGDQTDLLVVQALERLITDPQFRNRHYKKLSNCEFIENKARVLGELRGIS